MEISASALASYTQARLYMISAQIELESMKVANEERRNEGKALAYDESAFLRLQQNMISNAIACIGWIY